MWHFDKKLQGYPMRLVRNKRLKKLVQSTTPAIVAIALTTSLYWLLQWRNEYEDRSLATTVNRYAETVNFTDGRYSINPHGVFYHEDKKSYYLAAGSDEQVKEPCAGLDVKFTVAKHRFTKFSADDVTKNIFSIKQVAHCVAVFAEHTPKEEALRAYLNESKQLLAEAEKDKKEWNP